VAVASFAPRCKQITTPVPHHSVFTGRMPFLPPNQQRQSTEGKYCNINDSIITAKGENVQPKSRVGVIPEILRMTVSTSSGIVDVKQGSRSYTVRHARPRTAPRIPHGTQWERVFRFTPITTAARFFEYRWRSCRPRPIASNRRRLHGLWRIRWKTVGKKRVRV